MTHDVASSASGHQPLRIVMQSLLVVALCFGVAEGAMRVASLFAPDRSVEGWDPQASVRIYGKDFKEIHNYADKIPINRDAVKKWEEECRKKYGGGDLNQFREFSAKTIFAIGDLLKS